MDSRDDGARRKVATEAGRAAHIAAAGVANGTCDPEVAYTAASAVVLASDLRAPLPTRIEPDGEVVHVPADESPFRVPSGAVSPNRQGWRARLANVERWLADVAESIAISTDGEESAPDWSRLRTGVDVALAEVRAMIDGAE